MNDPRATAQRPLSAQEFLQQRRRQRLESRTVQQPASQTQPALRPQVESSPDLYSAPTQDQLPDQRSDMDQEDQTMDQEDQDMNQAYAPELPDAFSPEKSRVAPGLYKPIPEQELYGWVAPSRPFKKRNRKFFINITVIALLLSMILVFIGQILPVAVVFSVVFLVYILSVIPPQNVQIKISNYGIRVEDVLYYWEEMGSFWLEEKYDQSMIFIEIARFPGRLSLMLAETPPDLIRELLSEVLLNKKPELTTFEKAAKWLQDKFPLET